MDGFISPTKKLFSYYQKLGEGALAQVEEQDLFIQLNENSNSLAIIVKHLSGNMLSRWTDFLISDGEKDWRNRDDEFEGTFTTKEEVMDAWNKGWECFWTAVDPLEEADLHKVVYIRNEGHSVQEALLRQLAHYSSHIGQIILLAKALKKGEWKSLSIPKNKSAEFNANKFAEEKSRKLFTDGKSTKV